MDRVTRSPLAPRTDLALLVLRVVFGITFAIHGYQKLFIFGFGGVSNAFTQMGVPMAGIAGPLVAVLEFFGGIALFLGLMTRLAALGLVIDMLGAILLVHMAQGFFAPKGVELVLLLMTGALALALAGAGEYSSDAAIARRRAPGEHPR